MKEYVNVNVKVNKELHAELLRIGALTDIPTNHVVSLCVEGCIAMVQEKSNVLPTPKIVVMARAVAAANKGGSK